MAVDCCSAYAPMSSIKGLGSNQLPGSPAQERQATSKALWGVEVWAESTSVLPSHIQHTRTRPGLAVRHTSVAPSRLRTPHPTLAWNELHLA